MENLRAWLNGCRDYTSGVALYNEYGSDPSLKRMFAEAESGFKKKRLEKTLEALWDGRTVVDQKRELAKESIPAIKPALDNKKPAADLKSAFTAETTIDPETAPRQLNGWPTKMDETLTALYAQWKKLFLEQKDLQSRLYEVAKLGVKDKAKEKEAGTMALNILNLRDEINAVYEKRDYYLQHGRLPDPPAPVAECLDPALYSKSYQNAMRYAREYRTKLQDIPADDPKYLKTQQQLQKWEAEAEKYRKLLKMD